MKKFRQLVRENEDFESEAARTYKEKPNKEPIKKLKEQDDTTEKEEMAQTQLHFIKYASEEIIEFIEMGGEIEEWYQNKLSKVHSDMEGLHSYIEGEKRRTGMVKEEEIDEGIGSSVAAGVGQFIGNKIDPMHGEILRTHGAVAGRMAEYHIRKGLHKIHKALQKHLSTGNPQHYSESVELDEEEYNSVPASKSLQKRHEDERKKRGLPDPDYYLKLRDQKKKEIEDMKKEEVEQIEEISSDMVKRARDAAFAKGKDKQAFRFVRKSYEKSKKESDEFGRKMAEEIESLEEKNVPTSPEKWAQAKAQAKAKFDIWPSAYASGWASKKYKEMGGGWKSVSEESELEEGYYKSKEIEKQETERLKPPFTPDKPKKQAVAGKHGSGYSTARHLARQAMKKYVKEEDTEKFYTSSRKSQIVKNAAKNKNANNFEPDPELSKMADKKD